MLPPVDHWDILDNKWTEVDKWQDNRKTIGGLKSVMDVGDGLSFAAGYQLTTTEICYRR